MVSAQHKSYNELYMYMYRLIHIYALYSPAASDFECRLTYLLHSTPH
jgi:hypothetical protein